MTTKIFLFKGKTMEELKAMELKDFANIINSRQRRSLKKGLKEQEKRLLKKINDAKSGKRKRPIKTHVRDMVIIPEMVGATINIHNGKEYVQLIITEHMLGHYLGEFSMTRRKVEHSAPGVGATKSSASQSVK